MDTRLELDSHRMTNLALGQSRVLAMIAAGAALKDTLDALLRFLEQDVPEMACSVLLMDPDGIHMHPCSAPSLPLAYSEALEGARIGPGVGSCGTAAWRRERVIVEDIESDPLWADFRELARRYGLRACWSMPIFDSEGSVLGTFAMYFRQPRRPEPLHERIIDIAQHVAAIAIGHERRERQRLEAGLALRDSEERYRLINMATKDAVWDWDLRRNTLWWNNGVESLFGYPHASVPSDLDWWVERVHPEDRDEAHHSLHDAACGSGNTWSADYRFLRADGSYADIHDRGYIMRDENGVATRMIGMMQDISERKRAEARIRDLAYNDQLTRLPNRVAMGARLSRAVAEARDNCHALALLLLNLNSFRDINNTLGHVNGDLLLRDLAERLRGAVSTCGEVAALGGDEFAILLPRLRSEGDVELVLHAVTAILQEPVRLAGIPVRIEGTFGIALYPQDGSTDYQIWQRADIALRTAKERFESHLYYSAGIDHYEPGRLELLGELGGALECDQIVMHYQPRIHLATGSVAGVEALVRWQHPTQGLIFPDAFLTMAERTNLINPLTACVLKRGLREGLNMLAAGHALDLGINLSARNLQDPFFCTTILRLVDESGFPPARLTLEVTETAVMADPVRGRAALQGLHDAGIRLAMDDFGIGQSSLAYLKELPLDKLKIDKSFVMEFAEPRNAAIVRSAIELARNLGLQVTAEGVEHEATYLALREFGCNEGQGYFFGRPMPFEQLMRWLRESPWKSAAADVLREEVPVRAAKKLPV